MSPLYRLDWLRRVRHAGAPLVALAVAIEVAYRDGGDGAWGNLSGGDLSSSGERKGRAWVNSRGFIVRRQRAWMTTIPGSSTATPVAESATPVADASDDRATAVAESATPVAATATPVAEKRYGRGTEQGLTRTSNKNANHEVEDDDPLGLVSRAAPSADERRAAAEAVARAHSPGDLQAVHPILIVFRGDVDRLGTLFRLYGFPACDEAARALTPIARARPDGKRRVLVDELGLYLSEHFEPEPDDYRRAGLPVPNEVHHAS